MSAIVHVCNVAIVRIVRLSNLVIICLVLVMSDAVVCSYLPCMSICHPCIMDIILYTLNKVKCFVEYVSCLILTMNAHIPDWSG